MPVGEYNTLIIQALVKTRETGLIPSGFLTSDLEQFDQEGRGGIVFLFFGRLFRGFSFLASVLL